jgi:hypothetical protein
MIEDTISPVLWDYRGYTAAKLNAVWQYIVRELVMANQATCQAFDTSLGVSSTGHDLYSWPERIRPPLPIAQSDYLTEGFK